MDLLFSRLLQYTRIGSDLIWFKIKKPGSRRRNVIKEDFIFSLVSSFHGPRHLFMVVVVVVSASLLRKWVPSMMDILSRAQAPLHGRRRRRLIQSPQKMG